MLQLGVQRARDYIREPFNGFSTHSAVKTHETRKNGGV